MTKPITIPRDLKPGDRLWYSKDKYAVVSDDPSWHRYRLFDAESIHAWDNRGDGCGRRYYENGREIDNDTPPIIRIERIASAKPKKAKGDRDAKWLASMLDEGRHKFTEHAAKRIRAIARRLEGGK